YLPRVPCGPAADPDSTSGYAAGQLGTELPLFPADATMSDPPLGRPGSVAATTASCSTSRPGDGLVPTSHPPPRLTLMIRAPCAGGAMTAESPCSLPAGSPAA